MKLARFEIRGATEEDRDAIWEIFHEVVAAGDTYAIDPEISREKALAYWFDGTHTYVAELERNSVGEADSFPGTLTASPTAGERGRDLVGTYILRPNQTAGGAHVANAGFMVGRKARGAGVGRAMAAHCLNEARRLGFRAMQFNFVVSTNESAIHLWKELGFDIVGTLPAAFRHPKKGYVDVFVMYRSLIDG